MTNQKETISPQLSDDDKLTPVMIYTSNKMVWGQVFSKQAIRVNTWLFSDMAPTYMKIFNAQVMFVGSTGAPVPVKHPILHLHTSGINAFHLMPPFAEGVDYDADEHNRKFEPITAYIDYFRFDGLARMASLTTMDNYLGAAKGEYISIYDCTMVCPLVPSIKGIKAPMALLRQTRVIFASEEE